MPALTPKIIKTPLTRTLTPRAKCYPKRKIKISTLASDPERADPRSAKPPAALPLHQPSQVLMRAKVVITNLQSLILDQAATVVWKMRVIQIMKK